MDTLLRILPRDGSPGIDLGNWSARGIKTTLAPLVGGEFWRDVNGTGRWSSVPGHRKYRLSIEGNDGAAPPLSGVWPGMPVSVEVPSELAFTGGGPERPVVVGSTRTETRDGVTYTYYRPVLPMILTGWSADDDEWAAARQWSMTFEEV